MFSCTMIISLICIAIRHKAELALDHAVWQNSVFCECEEILFRWAEMDSFIKFSLFSK